MAISQNSVTALKGDRDQAVCMMKKSVLAVLWHCTATEDEDARHRFCRRDVKNWCQYWQKGDNQYKCSVNIPVVIHDVIKPVFIYGQTSY